MFKIPVNVTGMIVILKLFCQVLLTITISLSIYNQLFMINKQQSKPI